MEKKDVKVEGSKTTDTPKELTKEQLKWNVTSNV